MVNESFKALSYSKDLNLSARSESSAKFTSLHCFRFPNFSLGRMSLGRLPIHREECGLNGGPPKEGTVSYKEPYFTVGTAEGDAFVNSSAVFEIVLDDLHHVFYNALERRKDGNRKTLTRLVLYNNYIRALPHLPACQWHQTTEIRPADRELKACFENKNFAFRNIITVDFITQATINCANEAIGGTKRILHDCCRE